jgi:hypothetical protein
LLCTEDGPDPRDFYASDSPVLDEYLDLGQGSRCVDPEVEDDDQVESIISCHVWFSYLTYTSQANWCEKHSQKPQVLPRQCLLAQPQSFTPSSQAAGPSSSQTAGPSPSRQMLPLRPPRIPAALLSRRDRPSVSQHQDVASSGHSTRPMSILPHLYWVSKSSRKVACTDRPINVQRLPCQALFESRVVSPNGTAILFV